MKDILNDPRLIQAWEDGVLEPVSHMVAIEVDEALEDVKVEVMIEGRPYEVPLMNIITDEAVEELYNLYLQDLIDDGLVVEFKGDYYYPEDLSYVLESFS